MATSYINGVITIDQLATDREVYSIDDAIHKLNAAADFTKFLKSPEMKKKQIKINSLKREWFEDDLMVRVYTTGTGGWSSPTLTVTESSSLVGLLREGDILMNESDHTQKAVVVSTSGQAITVSDYGTTSFAPADGAKVKRISNVAKDASEPGSARSRVTDLVYNYAQMFETTTDMGLTDIMLDTAGGDEKARVRHNAGEEHLLDLEMALLFGVKYADTTNKRWYTEGLLTTIANSGVNWDLSSESSNAGKLSQDRIIELIEKAFTIPSASGTKLAWASPAVISILDKLVFSKVRLQNEEMFGVKWKRLSSSNGDLLVRKHPLLTNTDTTKTDLSGMMFIIDPDYVKPFTVKGFDDSYFVGEYKSMKTGYRGVADFYFSWMGLQTINPQRHMILSGVDGYV